ncbi:hypothetical protein [Oceanibacterium hippocampi]|uniref:Amidohydrolase n=1 Tax=Oceanibacterium hippocampi TaxID=745714 RepID=A0A1Y5RDT5_9PROT|nr:hypothetical protein [Oceanibacterium hippocampi]SLN12572.1 hypothetical protein OCH7691_00167 [Oceanibacterium hippocampi]
MKQFPAAALAGLIFLLTPALSANAQQSLYDSHFHYLNYNQDRGMLIRPLREAMKAGKVINGTSYRISRSTLFGIPLQQRWDPSALSGMPAKGTNITWTATNIDPNVGAGHPFYYLDTHPELYYYSGVDPLIAAAYCSDTTGLTAGPNGISFWDPMITGFNPADVHAVDHMMRMMAVYPGVFRGIGEFTVHKEVVSTKVAGARPSFDDGALDQVFRSAAALGLVVILHSDMYDFLDSNAVNTAAYFDATYNFLAKTKQYFADYQTPGVIWAHTGVGRFTPQTRSKAVVAKHLDRLKKIIADQDLKHVAFDISWDYVAKFLTNVVDVGNEPDTTEWLAAMNDPTNDWSVRFVWGSDSLSPPSGGAYLGNLDPYIPILTADYTRERAAVKIQNGNYKRIFDDPLRVMARKYYAKKSAGAGWQCNRDAVIPDVAADDLNDTVYAADKVGLTTRLKSRIDTLITQFPLAARATRNPG